MICSTNGAIISRPRGYTVALTCPTSISSLCSVPLHCKNFCNNQGFCVNNLCCCIAGYSINYCEIACTTPIAVYNSVCQIAFPTGYFVSRNQVSTYSTSLCASKLLVFTHINLHTFNKKIIKTACFSSATTQCYTCNTGYYLLGATCSNCCPAGAQLST